MSAVHVFFFRGLSTYGQDDAKWSVFNFGPIFRQLEKAFAQRDIIFHPVLGMGAGPLLEVTARAQQFLDQHSVWKDPETPVHFLGHSAGGLIARLLCDRGKFPPGKVLSLMTLASPNRGAQLARICIEMPKTYRNSARVLNTFGYNVAEKRPFFEELTVESVGNLFAQRMTSTANFRTASIVCHAPRPEWCRPLRLFYKVRAFNEFNLPSDGVIERDTQSFGEVIAELNIDHFRQIGLFGEPQRFGKMCDILTDFFKETQKIN